VFSEYEHHDIAVYAGYLTDTTKLLESSSGGIATAMAEQVIEQGGYVVGVAYSDDWYTAEYIIIDKKADMGRLKGSKYIECKKNNVFSKVKQLLSEGKAVLFFGLPCVVAALYKFLGTRPDNLISCELICHGPTMANIHKEYIQYLECKYRGKIVDFSVRYKQKSWGNSYLYAKFDNGKVYCDLFQDTEYGYAFSIYGKEACYQCKFKGNNRCADVMIGDFWGAMPDDEFYNKLGVSAIFAETNKGNAFIKSIRGIELFSTTFKKAVEHNPMVIKSREKMDSRDEFFDLLSKKGLIYAANHSMNPKARIKKRLLTMIPCALKPTAKKFYHYFSQRK